ncbi:MAG TPA: acyltransferase [Methylovirgula sp.]|nr:acyltransferase [Methylovirgula sp.]
MLEALARQSAKSSLEQEAKKLGLLELGRGLASALVVFHHSGDILAEKRFYGIDAFGGHLHNFNVGVDFFFVLSGFIIAWVHWGDIGKRDRLGRYAVRRFSRIYPPYWCILVPLIILYQIFPAAGAPSQHDLATAFFSIPLLPYVNPPVLGVAWTLVHEVFFYTLFGFIIAIGFPAIWMLAAWGLAILVCSFFGELGYPANFIFDPFNLEFLFGVGAAVFLQRYRVPLPSAFLGIGTGIFLLALLFGTHIQDVPIAGRAVFGLSSLAIVVGAVELELRHTIRLPPVLALLGAGSYAVYLVHPEALSALCSILARFGHRAIPLNAAIIITSLLAIGIGLTYHVFVESPVTKRTRRALTAGLERFGSIRKWA